VLDSALKPSAERQSERMNKQKDTTKEEGMIKNKQTDKTKHQQ
jgi:hypothetical protein